MSEFRVRCPERESGSCIVEGCNGFLQNVRQTGYADDGQVLCEGFCYICGWNHYSNLRPVGGVLAAQASEDEGGAAPKAAPDARTKTDWCAQDRTQMRRFLPKTNGNVAQAARILESNGNLKGYKNAKVAARAYSDWVNKHSTLQYEVTETGD